MRRESRLKKLPAYFGWKEPRLFYLNYGSDSSRLEHQKVNTAHTRVTSFALTYEEWQLMVPATSRITNKLESTVESLLDFIGDSKMKWMTHVSYYFLSNNAVLSGRKRKLSADNEMLNEDSAKPIVARLLRSRGETGWEPLEPLGVKSTVDS